MVGMSMPWERIRVGGIAGYVLFVFTSITINLSLHIIDRVRGNGLMCNIEMLG